MPNGTLDLLQHFMYLGNLEEESGSLFFGAFFVLYEGPVQS